MVVVAACGTTAGRPSGPGAASTGAAGAAAAMFVAGAANGLGNVTFLTVMQKRTPAVLLGRVMSALMLCAFGSHPLSVAVSGVLVRHIGPSLFFPVAGGLVLAHPGRADPAGIPGVRGGWRSGGLRREGH